MRLIANAQIKGECPSPTTKVHGKGRAVRAYEIKVQQATPKWIREEDDKRYRLRVDFHMNTSRLKLSDLDNMAKTIMDGTSESSERRTVSQETDSSGSLN